MTTNKNNTAIAPTYIIIKIRPKNSAFKINKIADALQKAKIKNKTEWIGFIEIKTNKLLKSNKKVKKKCKSFI